MNYFIYVSVVKIRAFKTKPLVIISLCLLLVIPSGFSQVKSLKPKDLPEVYYRWLEEEVVYIISPLEREVFLKLQTDRERDLFIESFWKHRDPNPATEENEFKKEHYRRISYANHYFGRTTSIPGWKTDRGRVYIILGEPRDIQRFEGQSQTYPAEVWFYQGLEKMGLPSGFNLVFFKPQGIGDFRLYSPNADGPMALMTSYYGDPMDFESAYRQLHEYQPELANVSLSLIPGEESTALGRPSLSSQMLLQQIETSSWRELETKYARKFLEYKDLVEVEYSTNYIDSDALVCVFQASNGMYFVHYALEPARLSVSEQENLYFTNIKVNGTLTGDDGKLIYQFEKTLPIKLNQQQMQDVSHQPFIIHDMFPIVAGAYKFSLLIKNEVSKEFTTFERKLRIPAPAAGPLMMPILLGYNASKMPSTPGRLRPFQLAGHLIYAQPNRVFVQSDTMSLAFQITGLNKAHLSDGELSFVFYQNDQEFKTFTRRVKDYPSAPEFIENIPLSEFKPAHYKVTVSFSFGGQVLASASEEFDITYRDYLPRPWVQAKVIPGPDDPSHLFLTGIQLYNQGRIDEAIKRMEKAVSPQPDSPEFALKLAQAYLTLKDYRKVEELLNPFFNQARLPAYELYVVLGQALQNSGQFSRAINIFDQAIEHYGVNTVLLNALGECHLGLGDKEAARVVWEKSLSLNPDQPEIKKKLEELKAKK
jgi:GWxTD domain-containing protein